jgi:MFS family permease
MFRSLRSRNYRLYFGGQGISLIGTWLTKVATAWLVFQLIQPADEKREAFILGVVSFAGLAPALVLAPLAGVFVDRHDRYRVLLVTQILALFQSIALAVLALSGLVTVAWVIVLQLVQGVINAFDVPARQALTVDLVERREELPNAIALNSSMFNSARLIGPMVAGFILARTNAGWCFTIDAISYVAVILSLLMLTQLPKKPRAGGPLKAPLHELREGFSYSFGSPPLRALLILAAMVSMLGMSMQTLLPIFATELDPGFLSPIMTAPLDASSVAKSAPAFGALMTAMGCGALMGTVYLAKRKSVVGLGRVVAGTACMLGLAQISFSFMHTLAPAIVLAGVAGGSMVCTMAGCNTILQTLVDDHMRGRLMSFFTMAVMGMAPFGSLLAAALSARLGAAGSVLVSGSICLLGGMIFASRLPGLRPIVRKIYVARGIIPEVAAGIQTASEATTPD